MSTPSHHPCLLSYILNKAHLADAEVARPEVVRPLREAVGLIDAGEGDWGQPRQAGGGPSPKQRLGGQHQHLHLGRPSLRRAESGAPPKGLPATQPSPPPSPFTFLRAESRCCLAMPEWMQAAFRHGGRPDTCRRGSTARCRRRGPGSSSNASQSCSDHQLPLFPPQALQGEKYPDPGFYS